MATKAKTIANKNQIYHDSCDRLLIPSDEIQEIVSNQSLLTPSTSPHYQLRYEYETPNNNTKTFSFDEHDLLGCLSRNSIPNSECLNETEHESNDEIVINQSDIDEIYNEINGIELIHKQEIDKLNEEINTLRISNKILNSNIKSQYMQLKEHENTTQIYDRILSYFNNKYNENININNFANTNTNTNKEVQMDVPNIRQIDNETLTNESQIIYKHNNTFKPERHAQFNNPLNNTSISYGGHNNNNNEMKQTNDKNIISRRGDYSQNERDELIFCSNYETKEGPLEEVFVKPVKDDPFEWDPSDVTQFLRQNGLKKYKKSFKKEEISGEILLADLDFEHLIQVLDMEMDDAKLLVGLVQQLRINSDKYIDFVIENDIDSKVTYESECDSLIDYEDQYEFEMFGRNIAN